MRIFKMLAFALAIPASLFVLGQEIGNKNNSDLEKVLWDVESQQWLNTKLPPDEARRVRFASWADQFFEVYPSGVVATRAEMVASQSAAKPTPGTGAFPHDFKLRAVYGNFALATDHTAFKTLDANHLPTFTGDSRWLRLFVQENGKWMAAAGAGVPTVAQQSSNTVQQSSLGKRPTPDAQLEKQLAAIDTKWLDSATHKRVDYLNQLFTDQWFEIVGFDPTAEVTKAYALDVIPKSNPKPGEGMVVDQFKLWAIYGDVALATDRRTLKWTNANGQLVTTPHRSLLVFVKQNGQWRSAGAALVPVAVPQ